MILYKYLLLADISKVLMKIVARHVEINPNIDIDTQLDGYTNVICELQNMDWKKSTDYIITVDKYSENEGSYDGCVFVQNLKTNEEVVLSHLKWKELLGLEVDSLYNLEDTLFYIIWELTWWGFSEEEINKNLNNI